MPVERSPRPAIPNVVEAAARHQRLPEWKAADLKRLKLPERLLLAAPAQLDAALAQLDVLKQLDNPESKNTP